MLLVNPSSMFAVLQEDAVANIRPWRHAALDPCIAVGNRASGTMSGPPTLNFKSRLTRPRRPHLCRSPPCQVIGDRRRARRLYVDVLCTFASRGDQCSFRACHSPRRRAPRAPPPRRPNPQPITRCESTLGQVCCAVLEIFRADGHRLSGWNSSTIDPKHARKRRHHHSRAGCKAAFARRHAHRGHLAQHVGVPRRGLRRPLEQPQPSPRSGSVAYSPEPERGQSGAARGGDRRHVGRRDRT